MPSLALRSPACDDRPLWDVWLSRFHLPAVVVADELGFFALVHREAPTIVVLGERLAIGARGAEALAGVLSSLGFVKLLDGRCHLTEVAREYLLPDSPHYWGGVLAAFRAQPHRHSPTQLLQALQEHPDAETARPTDSWEAGAISVDEAQLITAYMQAHSSACAMGLARAVALPGACRVLDVGAGSGCFSVALAAANPELTCTLMDLPSVCTVAQAMIRGYGLGDRLTPYAADFFRDRWPTDCDVVLMSNILHDWEAHRCHSLLRAAFTALPPGGRILVHEMLNSDGGDGNLAASSFSLQMVVGTRGKQLTAAELTTLLVEAGFQRIEFVNSFGYFWTAIGWKA